MCRTLKAFSFKPPQQNPEARIKLNPSERREVSSGSDQGRMRTLSEPLSARALYLYLALHANGSCETSQTFFPTVTFHQSGRGTRGPREDGSWSAPSHWLFGSSSWRPMARGPGSGQSQGNRLQPSIITPFTSEHRARQRTRGCLPSPQS